MKTVTFCFRPEWYSGEIRSVGLMGNFLFYESNLKGHSCEAGMADHTREYMPEMYRADLTPIGNRCYREMTWQPEHACYEISWNLPEGLYYYRFVINAQIEDTPAPSPGPLMNALCDDGRVHGFGSDTVYLTDPDHPPRIPTVTGQPSDSVLYLGNANDMPWLPPEAGTPQGTVTYMSYTDIQGLPRSLGVYLPPGYDRGRVYPVIYVTHGGGGTESSWFHLGGLNHIMDTMIARRQTEEAIVVTMNNSVYAWDFDEIGQNLYECIIPFINKLFPVSAERDRHAFCGLSMGSMTTLWLYMHRNEYFRYFGAFSGGIAGGRHFSLEDPVLRELKLMIGCGEEDIAWNPREIGIPPTLEALKAKNIPHVEYFVPGGHDWFCWSQMYTEFVTHVLWK